MISVIIPTWNTFEKKRWSIRFVLLFLSFQSTNEFEVIVVHNWGDEDFVLLDELIKSNTFAFDICLYKYTWTTSATRNFWVKQSQYDKIVFIDDDTLLIDNHIISKSLLLLNEYDYFLGAERMWVRWNSRFGEKYDYLIQLKQDELQSEIFANSFYPEWNERENWWLFLLWRTFIASFWGINKSVFEEVGWFPEDYLTYEDDILMYYLFTWKYNWYSMFDIKVYHIEHPRSKDESNENYFQQQFINFLVEKQNPGYCTLEEMQKLEERQKL